MLTAEDQAIFDGARRTSDLDVFTEYYFRLPWSGTWFTIEDRPEQYEQLYQIWRDAGQPGESFTAVIEGAETELKVAWDEYYGGYPMILLPHGFRSLDWLKRLISPQINLAVAVTGTGSGKTAGCAIAALSYCALYPGFRFLNMAPTGAQANLMLAEIEKWCTNTGFRRFIQTSRGAHELWIERPYPTITVEVYPGYPSTFVCQTVGRQARNVIGDERDWINCDETQLLEDIDAARPILVTRLRGTRATGMPRWGKLTWITNPGLNPELVTLMEEYQALVDDGHKDVLVLEGVDSDVNLYVTKKQLAHQKRVMSARIEDRWHGGLMSAAFADTGIDTALLDACRSQKLDVIAEETGEFSDEFGLRRYEIPFNVDHQYVVFGDAGKSNLTTMSSLNIPVAGVMDVTNFLEQPCELVALNWMDGLGSYRTFIKAMKHLMLKYRSQGYYDAGNVQTAFEDLGEGGFEGWPTLPIFFGGRTSMTRWADTIFIQMMSECLLAFPYIKGLWHQARIYDPSSQKRPDDLIAAMLVFAMALRVENVFWSKLVDRFKWGEDEETQENPEGEYLEGMDDRYGRLAVGR